MDKEMTKGTLEEVLHEHGMVENDHFDVSSGLTEGGVYVTMRHPGIQVRLDFDPDEVGPMMVHLATRLFPQAVDLVLKQMADEALGDDDDGD